MKVIGWFLTVFGLLSCFGAMTAGHSVFGPIFFVGLGLFLLHRANTKEEK